MGFFWILVQGRRKLFEVGGAGLYGEREPLTGDGGGACSGPGVGMGN